MDKDFADAKEEEDEKEKEEVVLEDTIPEDVLLYSRKIAALQKLLMNLDSNNIIDSTEDAFNTISFSDEDMMVSFVEHLLEVPDYRPLHIPFLIEFVSNVLCQLEPLGLAEKLRDEILRQLLLSVSNPEPFPNESSRPHFFYQCYRNGILDRNKIIEKFKEFVDDYTWFSTPVLWIGAYFIDILPSDLRNTVEKRLDKASNQIFIDFYQLQSLKHGNNYSDSNENADIDMTGCENNENNEEKKSTYKVSESFKRRNTNEIAVAIREDDIDELQTQLSPSFNFNARIEPCIFEECWFVQRNPTLICYAAYFGSIKAFKYLLLNHADPESTDDDQRTLAQFAVAGGNIEIVRLVEQAGCSLSETIHFSVHFYRPEVFEWLRLTKYPDLEETNYNFYTIIHYAAYCGNIELLLKCIELGCDVNKLTNIFYPQTPILKAAENGKSDALRILLSLKNIDTETGCNTESPLIFAARNGRDICVKLLCESEKVNVNHMGFEGTPLHYAAKFCQTRVAEILLKCNRVKPNLRNTNEMTPYDVAKENRAYKIMQLLDDGHHILHSFGSALRRFAKFFQGDYVRFLLFLLSYIFLFYICS